MLADRTRRFAVVGLAAVLAYGAGVASGYMAHPSSSKQSVIDEAEARIAAEAAHPLSNRQLESAAVQGMLSALDDQWSAYYAPADFNRFEQVLAGSYTGVGVWVRRDPQGELRIMTVDPYSPAALAGLHKGDVVVSVDGRGVSGVSVADVTGALRGDAGSEVTIVISRGAQQLTVHLKRAKLNNDDVAATTLGSGVERLRIAAFTRGVGRWVRARVADAEAKHLRGLVLDLRDDPGGLLDEAVETASAFLDGGPVVGYEQRGRPRQMLDALGAGDTAMPLVVLVDGGTASAAEIVAAALQDRGRAVLLGTRTFGKGSVQAPSQLSDGSALELTIGHYVTPSGRSIDGVGISPDVAVPASAGTAVLTQRAIEVLSGLTADAGSSGRG
jgi:carboxyl-terminal processing protease